MKLFRNYKYRVFWTIWALGWHRIVTARPWERKTIELKVFIGPLVLTFWR